MCVTSQQPDEFVGGDVGLTKDGAQGAPINLAVIGNNRLSKRVIAAHDDVTAMLSSYGKTKFLESTNDVGAGNLRELAHTATNRAAKCSSGTGKPSSCKART